MWHGIFTDTADMIATGGPVIVVLLCVSFLGWSILCWLFLTNFMGQRARSGDSRTAPRLLVRLRREDRLVRDRGALQFVALLAAAAPLLGLLGTVLGMMDTFAFLGQQDLPRVDALAGGVSQALLTTQMGLLSALCLLAGHTAIGRLLRKRADELGWMR